MAAARISVSWRLIGESRARLTISGGLPGRESSGWKAAVLIPCPRACTLGLGMGKLEAWAVAMWRVSGTASRSSRLASRWVYHRVIGFR